MVTCGTPDALQVHTGRMRREFVKLTTSPDATRVKPYVYTFALITLLLIYHHELHIMLHPFVIMWPPFHATIHLHHMCCYT